MSEESYREQATFDVLNRCWNTPVSANVLTADLEYIWSVPGGIADRVRGLFIHRFEQETPLRNIDLKEVPSFTWMIPGVTDSNDLGGSIQESIFFQAMHNYLRSNVPTIGMALAEQTQKQLRRESSTICNYVNTEGYPTGLVPQPLFPTPEVDDDEHFTLQ